MTSTEEPTTTEECKISEEFSKIMKDFIGDIKVTFPEFGPLISKWWKEPAFFNYIENEEERTAEYEKSQTESIAFLFQFCQKNIHQDFLKYYTKMKTCLKARIRPSIPNFYHIYILKTCGVLKSRIKQEKQFGNIYN